MRNRLTEWLLARLQEPSTWTGISGLIIIGVGVIWDKQNLMQYVVISGVANSAHLIAKKG